MKKLIALAAALFLGANVLVAGVPTPPSPAEYFNDYAGVVSPQEASKLEAELREFDQQTTNQIVVAIWPTSPKDVDLDQYTVDTARAWRVGQKDKNNGAVIFVFVKRSDTGKTKFRIEVGYGLEGAITDAMTNRIFETDFKPHCVAAKNGGGTPEWDKALDLSVHSTMLAAKKEYSMPARPKTPSFEEAFGISCGTAVTILIIVVIVFVVLVVLFGDSGEGGYGGGGAGYYGGDSSSGGSSSSGGDGGFSGGGGSFGGGGGGGDC